MSDPEHQRRAQLDQALEYVRQGNFATVALRAAGLDPASVTTEEQELIEAAELDAEHGALSIIERAAECDPEAAQWLRDRGLRD